MSSDAGRLGIIIAKGMPPPDKLKRRSNGDDSGGDMTEGSPDEEHSDDMAGESAVGDFAAAMKSGDHAAAWLAFKDMMDICNGADDKSDGEYK